MNITEIVFEFIAKGMPDFDKTKSALEDGWWNSTELGEIIREEFLTLPTDKLMPLFLRMDENVDWAKIARRLAEDTNLSREQND